MTLTVSRIEQIAQGVKVFELRDTAGGTLPACDSGAHIELRLSPGLVRRYSLRHPSSVRGKEVKIRSRTLERPCILEMDPSAKAKWS